MEIKEAIYEAFKSYLQSLDISVSKVTSFEEDYYTSGACHTCAESSYYVYIYYEDLNHDSNVYSYYGSLAELITKLTDGN